jgi:hypothetical protein
MNQWSMGFHHVQLMGQNGARFINIAQTLGLLMDANSEFLLSSRFLVEKGTILI